MAKRCVSVSLSFSLFVCECICTRVQAPSRVQNIAKRFEKNAKIAEVLCLHTHTQSLTCTSLSHELAGGYTHTTQTHSCVSLCASLADSSSPSPSKAFNASLHVTHPHARLCLCRLARRLRRSLTLMSSHWMSKQACVSSRVSFCTG